MACAHCLRGDAQAEDVTNEIIDKTLENVNSIGSLVFTGGEPSLNVDAMRYALRKCKANKIFVSSFFVVTNGKTVSDEFLRVLVDWYVFCVQNGGDTDLCGVALSKDDFHEKIPLKNECLLKAFSFFRDDKFHPHDVGWLVAEGRAAQIEGVTRTVCDCLPDVFIYGQQIDVEGTVYVTTRGDIINGCDWSYENQGKHRLGTVYDQTGWLKRLEELSTAQSA